MIFFISDNGAPLKINMEDKPGNGPGWDGSRNDPWIGEKGTLMEGGIRVPFIVTWPNTIPAGKTYDKAVSSLDVAATAMNLAGLSPSKKLDGVNLMPHLTGKTTKAPHENLYWKFWNQTAIRSGSWKYLEAGNRKFLFDLNSSEHEKKNLIEKHPDISKKLQSRLKKWLKEQKNPLVGNKLNGQEQAFYEHYLPLEK